MPGAGKPKAEVDARRPLEGVHPKGELEEGRIYFLYKCVKTQRD